MLLCVALFLPSQNLKDLAKPFFIAFPLEFSFKKDQVKQKTLLNTSIPHETKLKWVNLCVICSQMCVATNFDIAGNKIHSFGESLNTSTVLEFGFLFI